MQPQGGGAEDSCAMVPGPAQDLSGTLPAGVDAPPAAFVISPLFAAEFAGASPFVAGPGPSPLIRGPSSRALLSSFQI